MRSLIGLGMACVLVLGSASLARANRVIGEVVSTTSGTVQDMTGQSAPMTFDDSITDLLAIMQGAPAAYMSGLDLPAFWVDVASVGAGANVYFMHQGAMVNPSITGGWDPTGTMFSCTTSYSAGDVPGSTMSAQLFLPGSSDPLDGLFTSYTMSLSAEGLNAVDKTDYYLAGQTWHLYDQVALPSAFSATFDGYFQDSALGGHAYHVLLSWDAPPGPEYLVVGDSNAIMPEPASFALLAFGGLAVTRRRSRSTRR